jgi:hypothetical protein
MSELSLSPAQRPVARPRVSYVIAWKGAPTELTRRLRIWERWADGGIEVVVACACAPEERQRIVRSHASVRVVGAPSGEDVSALRQRGVAAATGDIVVIVDDEVAGESSWRDELPAGIAADVPSTAPGAWDRYERYSLTSHNVPAR